jgi:hypothetical protein
LRRIFTGNVNEISWKNKKAFTTRRQ